MPDDIVTLLSNEIVMEYRSALDKEIADNPSFQLALSELPVLENNGDFLYPCPVSFPKDFKPHPEATG